MTRLEGRNRKGEKFASRGRLNRTGGTTQIRAGNRLTGSAQVERSRNAGARAPAKKAAPPRKKAKAKKAGDSLKPFLGSSRHRAWLLVEKKTPSDDPVSAQGRVCWFGFFAALQITRILFCKNVKG